jgi:putative ABC transport system substrate-binding protein
MNKRDTVLALLSLGIAVSAIAQTPPRVAIISPISEGGGATRLAALKDGLRDNGLIEGKHYVLDVRYADGNADRFPALAQDVVQRNAAVIVVVNAASVRAAQQATKTIPIVFIATPDPVGLGLVASLARPGGNTTGMTGIAEDLVAKHVELVQQTLPHARRLAVLIRSSQPEHTKMFDKVRATAAGFGIDARAFDAPKPPALDPTLVAIAEYRPDALLIFTSAFFYGERERISAFALKNRIPTVAGESEFVDAGMLMAYATQYTEMFRHAAVYVKKVLAGVKPADLPIEQPTRFELVINLKTAKALDIKIPQTILLRADRVIE